MGNSPPTRRKPLKILHVTGVDGGGVVDALRTYIRLQNEAVHFVAATNEIVRNDFAASGADTLDMSGSPLRARRVLRRYVRERAIDVVHAHSSWGGFQARASALGAPIIYQPHSFYFDNPNLSRLQVLLYQSAERLLSRRTDAFAVLTAHEERLAAGLEPGVPLYRLHNVSKFSCSTQDRIARSHLGSHCDHVGKNSSPEGPALAQGYCERNCERWIYICVGGRR